MRRRKYRDQPLNESSSGKTCATETGVGSESSNCFKLLLPIVLVTSFIVIISSWPVEWPLGPFGMAKRRVQRLAYPNNFKTYRSVAELRQPMILTNTVVGKWKASELWTPGYLSKVIRSGSVYSQSDNPTFITFHDNRTLEPIVSQSWRDFNVKSTRSLQDVLDTESDEFLYFSEDMGNIRQKYRSAMDDIQPYQDLVLSKKTVQINLWIGRPGIVTHTHYDVTYNFFVQLRGRKRFTLFPPGSSAYLYPCLHPHYGHSQADIKDINSTLYPLFNSSQAVVAELQAGDMLVLPPCWLHHVETLEESVSVNFWSVAEELTITDEIYKLPIPFEASWNLATMIHACRVYFNMLTDSVDMDFQEVWQSISLARYSPLMAKREITVNASVMAVMDDVCVGQDWPSLHQRWTEDFSRGVRQVEPLLRQISNLAIRQLSLANYMEHIVATALPLDHILPFFVRCQPAPQ